MTLQEIRLARAAAEKQILAVLKDLKEFTGLTPVEVSLASSVVHRVGTVRPDIQLTDCTIKFQDI